MHIANALNAEESYRLLHERTQALYGHEMAVSGNFYTEKTCTNRRISGRSTV